MKPQKTVLISLVIIAKMPASASTEVGWLLNVSST